MSNIFYYTTRFSLFVGMCAMCAITRCTVCPHVRTAFRATDLVAPEICCTGYLYYILYMIIWYHWYYGTLNLYDKVTNSCQNMSSYYYSCDTRGGVMCRQICKSSSFVLRLVYFSVRLGFYTTDTTHPIRILQR